MKTVLLIKQVPETSSAQIDEATGTVKRSAADAIVNPLDLYAVETAILLRDHFGGTITAFSMGPPGAIDALREVIAMGVDHGVLISDRAYAGSDTWATSNILAHAIRSELPKFDLILCGQRATDGETGQVGPETAAALNVPVITYVSKIDETSEPPDESLSFDPKGTSRNRTLHVTRTVEGGVERIRVSFPALLTIDKTNV
ncbi:MAG: electron transfer flavoprotein subunit beta/FixA family protein, partial [Planctomycetia bacterium]|nr:electron transfer flavoprotein subunit beta/FixA family protein [Planctomycetia bacterium]